MACIRYSGVGIKAVAACVPPKKMYNKDLKNLIPEGDIEKTISSIGIREKRFAEPEVCASDLCLKAAQRLIEENEIDVNSIDLLLFLSQTPDYKIPATSPILQYRLGLPETTACLDLSLGCSGYVYGLSAAFAYASLPGINRVMLLDGETFSKIVNPKDKVNAPLYGDAGTATLIEKGGDFGTSLFTLYTDGTGLDAVIIPAGQGRNPTTCENLIEKEQEESNIRSENEIFMDGMDVFNFATRRVPRSIKEIVQIAGLQLADIDYLIFHQANKFMTDFFVKWLKFDFNKVPYCLEKYGNTSSASIPLTLSSELAGRHNEKERVIMCGFGAGLSWGTVLLTFDNCNISKVVDY